MKKIAIAAVLVATFIVGGIVAKAYAGTCVTTCNNYSGQRTCYTNCY